MSSRLLPFYSALLRLLEFFNAWRSQISQWHFLVWLFFSLIFVDILQSLSLQLMECMLLLLLFFINSSLLFSCFFYCGILISCMLDLLIKPLCLLFFGSVFCKFVIGLISEWLILSSYPSVKFVISVTFFFFFILFPWALSIFDYFFSTESYLCFMDIFIPLRWY